MSENSNPTPDDMNKALFSHLVMSLATSAMTHMGKLVDPASGKSEVNLDAAQSTIDVIEMLQAKTTGNLDAEESRFLNQSLTALRLNYVETVKATPGTSLRKASRFASSIASSPRWRLSSPPTSAMTRNRRDEVIAS